jgi:GNAT superfamily N-acetyltransferase
VLSSGSQFVLIVDHQSQTQGFAHVVIDGVVATVRRIFIATQARNLGAGAKLLTAVRTEAKLRGCKQIDAIALPGDRLTKNLFERANMKARLLIASSDL